MTPTAERTSPAPRRAGDRSPRGGARLLTVTGVLLLAFGIGCFGYVGWQLWGTNIGSRHAYESERSRIKQQWQQPDASSGQEQGTDKKHDTKQDGAAVPGNAIALLSVPAIGLHEVPVLEGTDAHVLARGIGHYRDTADPGQVGNFAVAGHRITHGEPFAKLLQLRKGDTVVVETRRAIYTYAIDTAPRKLTVVDTEGWVLDPVPGKKKAKPTEPLITLTTCQDLFHSPDRSVGFGHLVKTTKKS